MQPHTGRAGYGNVRAVGRLVVESMLHVHPGLGAFEDNMSVHTRHIGENTRTFELRMFT